MIYILKGYINKNPDYFFYLIIYCFSQNIDPFLILEE